MINYDLKLENIIKNLDYTPKLLLHSCCAPCSSYVLEYLSSFFSITVLFYNPNISPIDEYEKRKKELIRFIKEYPFKNKINFIQLDYDNCEFEKIAEGLQDLEEGSARCIKCYYLRLDKTALLASSLKFDYFATTLTVSPYKNSDKINEIGYSLEKKYNVNYLCSDFKKKNGYKRSIELSREYNLYRQNFCGCIYSKINREKKLEVKI